MEIIRENKTNNNSWMAIVGVGAFAFGAVLLSYSMYMLPWAPAYGFPWAFTGAVAAFLSLAIGAWCAGALLPRRGGESARYGHDNSGGIVFALWVIIAGILLVCFNGGLLPMEWRRVFFSWQMLLLVGSMTELGRGRFVWGGILLAVGGFFIMRRLAPIYPDIAASGADIKLWPILLILFGVMILGEAILKPRRRVRSANCDCGCRGGRSKDGYERGRKASGVIDITTVFGGSEQVYLDPEFRGGKISTVFGGVKLDLRRTGLPEGITYLTVESVFGGVEIDTPEDWIIEIRSESVFGGFDDKRLPPLDGNYIEGRKLIIKASCVFGGGEIK